MALGFNRGVYTLRTTINADGSLGPMQLRDQCWRGTPIQPRDLLVPVHNKEFFYGVNLPRVRNTKGI